MQRLVLFLLLLSFCIHLPLSSAKAGHNEQPGFGVDHYAISLNLDFQEEKIEGFTKITLCSKVKSLDTLLLSLLNYQVDSIVSLDQSLAYTYDDTTLTIQPPEPLDKGDTLAMTIYYQGQPPIDETGWGGFYFRKGFAFNLGVGFGAKPHNFGRAWFPCLDNFTDRATYDFSIEIPDDKKAFCNGRLQDVQTLSTGRKVWHWQLKDPIPTYLASVAAGPYATVQEKYNGLTDTFPVIYAVKPEDSADLKKGFQAMPEALEVFSHFYGPQPFSRVGYSVVPFSGGAMEHATNIAYPDNLLVGPTFANQRLWAHELSHHWWGDLATTHRAEEMWLNEGWATFSEFLFLDHTYGDSVYRKVVRDNHYQVLTEAHIRDGQYRPLVPVPHSVTYGMHSYNKGGDVINTLRHHLGDSLLKKGLRHFLKARAFQPITSTGLRDTLEAVTGESLEAFFRQWVFNPGFPHFKLQEIKVEQVNGQYRVSGSLYQQLHEAPALFQKVKLPITAFFEGSEQPVTKTVLAGGSETSFQMQVPKEPAYLVIDPDGRVADAKIIRKRKLNAQGNYPPFALNSVSVSVNSLASADLPLMAERHWVGPAAGQAKGYELSNRRYWRFEANFKNGDQIQATFKYDSTRNPDGLDPANAEDLVLMYKPQQSRIWEVYDSFSLSFLGRNGSFIVENLKAGEYCIAKPTESVGQGKRPIPKEQDNQALSLYPQPANDVVKLELNNDLPPIHVISVYNMDGQLLLKKRLANAKHRYQLSTARLPAGSYAISVTTGEAKVFSQKLLLQSN